MTGVQTCALPISTFTISVSGTRIGQSNVPEQVNASFTQMAKVTTAVALTSATLHTSGPFTNSGPVPPRPNTATTYAVVWNVQNAENPIAGGTVTATLPSYVSYVGNSSGTGSFTYDTTSNTVTWNVGDLAQNASAQGAFQVSLTPSTAQSGNVPELTSGAAFSGYDRYAGVQVSALASPATTETFGDPGYSSKNAVVQ